MSLCVCVFLAITPSRAAFAVGLVCQQVSTENELGDTAASGQEGVKAPDVSTLKGLGLPQPYFHSLVLDLGALSFVDTVCLKNLKNVRGWGLGALLRRALGEDKGPLSLLTP